MKGLRTLVMMQIREKFNMNFLRSRKSFWFRIIFSVLLFAVITAAVYGMFYLLLVLKIVSLSFWFPSSALVVIFTVMQIVAVITATVGLVGSLYLSSDNMILLAFPVKSSTVFLSKLIVFYINELRKNYLIFLPVFIAFGLVNRLTFSYFPITLIAYFLISLMPVIIGALLSIGGLFVAQFLRNFKWLQIVLAAIAASLLITVVFVLVNKIPANFNLVGQFGIYYWRIQDALKAFGENFLIFKWLTEMIVGKIDSLSRSVVSGRNFAIFGVYIAVLSVIMVASYFVEKRLFFYMASKPKEHRKVPPKQGKKNKPLNPTISSIKKELVGFLRSPSAFFTQYVSIFTLPFVIFLLNKIYASMNTRLLGNQLSMGFNVLMILLIILSSNISMASALSKEGKAVYIVKISPTSLKADAMAKIIVSLGLSVLSLIPTAAVVYAVGGFDLGETFFMFVTVLLIIAAHTLWSLELDILNPQYTKFFDGIHISINPNEVKSTIIAFLMSLAFFGIALFFFVDKMTFAWIKVLVAATAVFALRAYMFLNMAKVYFKEF